jgi:hypothetical protein
VEKETQGEESEIQGFAVQAVTLRSVEDWMEAYKCWGMEVALADLKRAGLLGEA